MTAYIHGVYEVSG